MKILSGLLTNLKKCCKQKQKGIYMSEYEENINRLERDIINIKQPVAVFDIGTRASRCSVGSRNEAAKDVNSWKNIFCNVGLKTMLGNDVPQYGGYLKIKSSSGLNETIKVINGCMNILNRYHLGPDDIVAVGTEVFRKMGNRDEVLSYIKKNTGLSIRVLTDQEEANVSLFITMMTYKKGLSEHLHLKDGQQCLVLDQGGGSLEVGVFSEYAGTISFQSKSVASLGTIEMRKLFFNNEPSSDDYCLAEDNTAKIYKQHERVLAYIDTRLNEELNDNLKFITKCKGNYGIAFGLGSAISKNVAGSDFTRHNKILSTETMDKLVLDARERLESSHGLVKNLYKLMKQLEPLEDDRSIQGMRYIDTYLTTLYGLPVYRKLLERLDLHEIRAQGYGLKYGIYLLWHLYGYDFDLKSRKEVISVGKKLPKFIYESQNVDEPKISQKEMITIKEKEELQSNVYPKTLLNWVGGNKATLAIVYTDIVGGSNIRKDCGNEKMNKMLEIHEKKAKKLIAVSYGWFVKRNDDSIMAVFKNGPDAFEFTRALYKTPGVKAFAVRAGIHVGLANIVNSETLGYDIDAVTAVKAHRVIEAIGKGFGIWISQEVKTQLDEDREKRHSRVIWKDEGEYTIKGSDISHVFYSVDYSASAKPVTKNTFSLTHEEQLQLLDVLLSEDLKENLHLEFKATAKYDTRLKKGNPILEKVIVETIAGFFNSEGGCLLIGVDDKSKTPLGLTDDYNLLKEGKRDSDGYINYLTQLLLDNNFGNNMSEFLRIYVCQKGGKEFCIILADKSTTPIYIKNEIGERFYVRRANSKKELTTSETVEYIKTHWTFTRIPWEFLKYINKPRMK